MLDTKPLLLASDFPPVRRGHLKILQANLGYLCNLSCTHCHVNAGPRRTELMSREVMDDILRVLKAHNVETLDLTGGAPEMNPHFHYLVTKARALGVEVIDRCNLSILEQPGYEDLIGFLAEQRVNVTASLPSYLEENVARQRGKGVYRDSINALLKLNEFGYGSNPELILNLVYNPIGPNLPPEQEELEMDYKRELKKHWGVVFNRLLTITNMPISRFGAVLLAKDQYVEYMSLLRNSFSYMAFDNVMCRNMVSIDWQGYLYDCDFNQLLEMPMPGSARKNIHIRDLQDMQLNGRPVVTGEHCYGCTAGSGSSCGGALID